MSSKSSGKKLEGFFTGKGFYIVLFLCAAVIGVSAWMMAAGNETMNDTSKTNSVGMDNKRVETIILSPESGTDSQAVMAESGPDVGVAAVDEETPVLDSDSESLTQVWHEGDVMEVAAPMYIWPIQGQLERLHSMDALAYDVTMRDWRTHEGVDLQAEAGQKVTAAAAGTVYTVYEDESLGMTVVLRHADGYTTHYSNLAEEVNVTAGQSVAAGDVLGTVGETACVETALEPHLHFAVYQNNVPVDPESFLGGE